MVMVISISQCNVKIDSSKKIENEKHDFLINENSAKKLKFIYLMIKLQLI
jgi:hypothetical protein